MKNLFFVAFVLVGTFLLSMTVQSCVSQNEEDLYGIANPSDCDTSKAKFAAFVSPLMTSQCATANCHSVARQASGINLGNYTAIKTYISSSKAVFLGAIKHSPAFSSMPQNASKLPACDIIKLETWINAGLLNN